LSTFLKRFNFFLANLPSELSRTSEDAELKEAAQAELNGLEEQFTEAFVAAVTVLLPAEDYDSSDAVIEVVPGAGGIEAGIFAQEIFDMYVAYTRSLGNNVEVTEYNASRVSGASNSSSKSLTGISRASATITGVGVFRALKFETGVHRVQRVPATSTRLQTSTCSVAVLPQPDLETFPIPKSDLKAEFMRSSGPGGQSVQTMNSAVRLTHLPTGTAVECQEGKSQMRNQEKALEKLKSILYQKKFSEELSMMQKSRKSQIGNMDRNEKVRTYNFTRNMITDHRIGESRQINLSQFFAGSAGFKPVEDFYTLLVGVTDRERLHFVLKSEP
jgi:peptide chain release factor 1